MWLAGANNEADGHGADNTMWLVEANRGAKRHSTDNAMWLAGANSEAEGHGSDNTMWLAGAEGHGTDVVDPGGPGTWVAPYIITDVVPQRLSTCAPWLLVKL